MKPEPKNHTVPQPNTVESSQNQPKKALFLGVSLMKKQLKKEYP